MLGTRHEEHRIFKGGLPFSLQININRSNINYSKESNWHENLEIELCDKGHGFVLLNAERYEIEENDIVVVNSDVIHYTGSETDLTYSCLIIGTEFCRNVGLDPKSVRFNTIIKSPTVTNLFLELKRIHADNASPYRVAKLNNIVLELLIELAEHHSIANPCSEIDAAKNNLIKSVIIYTRENYDRKITLDEIAKSVHYDKYALCREYKKYTGQTIIDDLNHYRCIKATELLKKGTSVSDTADKCGFANLSYFGKTFKKHIGHSPSKIQKKF